MKEKQRELVYLRDTLKEKRYNGIQMKEVRALIMLVWLMEVYRSDMLFRSW